MSQAGAARSLPLGSQIGDFGLFVDGYVPSPASRVDPVIALRSE